MPEPVDPTTPGAVRDITPEEVERYRAAGWVHLPGFVDPAVVAALLEAARASMGAVADRPQRSVFADGVTMWRRYDEPWREHEVFGRLCRTGALGGALGSLVPRPVGLRYFNDQVAVKVPESVGTTDETPWHQDNPYLPIDRTGDLTVWIALHDMGPDHGTMEFLGGSHREGPLEATLLRSDLREVRPEVWDRHPIEVPGPLRAGDATVHDGCTVHCAGLNTTDEPRWAYIVEYIPDDVRVARLPNPRADGAGLAEGDPFDHEQFPLVAAATA